MTTDIKKLILMALAVGLFAGVGIGCQFGFWIDDYFIHKKLTEKE